MQTIDTDTLVQSVSGILANNGLALMGYALLLLGSVWLWAKTGSLHLIVNRLFQLFLGENTFRSEKVGAYVDERGDLMRFRTLVGLKRIKTVAAAERLIDWIRQHDVDSDLVKSSGHYFNINTLSFPNEPPSTSTRGWLGLGRFFLFYVAVILAICAWVWPVMVQVKQSGIWYAVHDDGANQAKLGDGMPRFAVKACDRPAEVATSTKYSKHDVEVLCELMTKPEGHKYLASARTFQLWFGVTVVGSLALLAFALFDVSRKAKAARELYDFVKKQR